jgi:L-alanine-DL-glutamate epimerase-like enolase superfamily enzyme
MKITAVEPFHISVPYNFGNSPQNAAATQWPKMETLFVKVTTDQAVIGWGEGFIIDYVNTDRSGKSFTGVSIKDGPTLR